MAKKKPIWIAASARDLPAPVRRRRLVAWGALTFSALILALSLSAFFLPGPDTVAAQSSVRPPAGASVGNAPANGAAPAGISGNINTANPTGGRVPGNSLGINSDADLWRYVRGQDVPNFDATVSIPNKMAATLVQSQGDNWRAFRNGPLATYGAYALAAILGLLVVFFVVRGRVRIDAGKSEQTITRFTTIERFGHWLLAISFIALAITGLNVSYGRYFLPDLIGAEAFAQMTIAGKWIHNNAAWAFMLSLPLIFVMWVRHNIPSPRDITWFLKGGGLFGGGHPDAKKFNAGQKIIFWSVILLGTSVSLSGVALLFPYETAMMGKTFAIINAVAGTELQTNLSPIQEMQYQTLWHSIVALAMMVIVVAHIYIGSVGMEGAFDAMGNGEVDLNWAREHHNLWVADVTGEAPHGHGHAGGVKGSGGAGMVPAE
ncbi:MAG: formate dehydrogenase subunit gamma [Pseudomonadota bacterium]